MISRGDPEPGPETVLSGPQIRRARKVAGLTQQQLASRAHLSQSLVKKIEVGDRHVTTDAARAIAQALGTTVAEMASGHATFAADPRQDSLHESVRELERVLLSYELPPAPHVDPPRQLDVVEQDVLATANLRLDARYTKLAARLPALLEELILLSRITEGPENERVFWLLATALRCADALANKLGYQHLSYLAVERVYSASQKSGDPLMVATANYLRGQACLDVGNLTQGLLLLDNARDAIASDGQVSKKSLAVQGSLHLRSAVLAACDGDAENAWSHIAEARTLARHVGDDVTHYWTYFGTNNVNIHAVATAVELGDAARAIRESAALHSLNTIPRERSSHHYIDLSRAFLWTGNREQALRSLLTAEQIAPHHTHYHAAARKTAEVLLTLWRRGTPEGLDGLARRMGLRTIPG